MAKLASRIRNRRELRKQSDQTGETSIAPDAAPLLVALPGKKPRKTPVKRKPRAPKAPPRMRVRWGLFDGTMKQVAIFDYNQRAAADEKLADLLAKNKGIHFMQVVKEQMPEPPALELPT